MRDRYILTLSPELKGFIEKSSKKMGTTQSGYIRYLIMKEKEREDRESK